MNPKKTSDIIKYDRQKQVANFFKKNPYITAREASKILSIPISTLKNDIKEISENLKEESVTVYNMHRSRILKDIAIMKEQCLDKLKLCRGALSGTKWIDKWVNLTKQEVKILGLYAPERAMSLVAHVDGRENMTKEKRDAVIEAILVGEREGVIRVGPESDSRES